VTACAGRVHDQKNVVVGRSLWRKRGKSVAKEEKNLVTLGQVAVAFKISDRQVQSLVIYEGTLRHSRGECDLDACLVWYAAFLHEKVCGCVGPCDGITPEEQDKTNARAERKRALKEIAAIAPELVSLKAAAIRKVLLHAVEEIYEPEEAETSDAGDGEETD
jgi:hypothetical protein